MRPHWDKQSLCKTFIKSSAKLLGGVFQLHAFMVD